MIGIALLGAGRIGTVHAGNIAASPRARLAAVVDADPEVARRLAERHGAPAMTLEDALAEPSIACVLVTSPTETHAALVEAAARAGKAIFCEKPVDLARERVARCLATAAEAGVPLLVGFNRRYDPHFAALKQAIDAGRIGRVELVAITSRDPAPPPLAYLKGSGGLFRDMTIHDFDMARWLLPEEPAEVFAAASVLVGPEIGAIGDVDTALVTLRTRSGALCQISNSRRAVYGYDQRIEAFGEKGMLQVGNVARTTVVHADADGVVGETPLPFFLERYAEAYRLELEHFLDVVEGRAAPRTTGADGLKALVLADAAHESARTGRSVAV